MNESTSTMGIADILLSWSIEEITNQNLLKVKVKPIPKEFSSVNHYLDSFRYPLIEEARAELSTSLFCVSEAPYVGIIVGSCNVPAGSSYEERAIFSFSVYCDEQRGKYVPKVGDIVLLSTVVPTDFEDLQKAIRPFCLAIVNEAGLGDGKQCKGKLGKFGSKEISRGGSSYVAVYLMKSTEISHMWNSLNVDTTDPCINLNLIKKSLRQEVLVKSCTCIPCNMKDVLHEKMLSKLNGSQIDVIRCMIASIKCTHSASINAISGLCGTGKTEVSTIIALAALGLKQKVIVCVPPKFSVFDVASRFQKIVDDFHSDCNLEEILVCGENDEEPNNITGNVAAISYNLNMLKNSCRRPIAAEDQCIKSSYLEKSRLIFCPLRKLQSLKAIGPVDVLIVDGASHIGECETIFPFQLLGLRHVILIGNGYDIQPANKSKISGDAGYARSLFERLESLCPPKIHLDTQYRMHPAISKFPNKKLLDGRLLNGLDIMNSSQCKCKLREHIYKAYSFLDVADGKEVLDDYGDGWKNVVEAAVVTKIVMKLFHTCRISEGKLSVGVISPYESQVHIIRDMLSDRIKSNTKFSVWVRSSDGTQNCEADVVIISTVRCNNRGSVGVLSDQYLTCISLTRARHCLWIVGNQTTLIKSDSIWQDVVHDVIERGCIFHAREDKDVAGVIFDVKRELDELNDLLNQESVFFNDKKWKIIFSDDFKQSFASLKSLFIKQIVLGFLLRLSNGWRPKRRCTYPLKPFLQKYVKLYKVHGLYLLCTTEIMTASKIVQVLKIWNVLPLMEIAKHISQLEELISICSVSYMKSCMKEKHEGNLVVPVSWDVCSDFIKYKDAAKSSGSGSGSNCLVNSQLGENLLLMKFYSLSSVSVKNLLKSGDGKEIELPFEVSDVELDITRYPWSAFVLGRSGTGKTVISIMKLMQREQAYIDATRGIVPFNYNTYLSKSCENHASGDNGLRQIFVTVSANLCSAVSDYVSRIRRCLSDVEAPTNLYDSEMLEASESFSMFSDIPDSFIDITQRHFPLVVSMHKFLLMLDGSLSYSYFDRFHDLKVVGDGKRSSVRRTKQQLIRGKEVRYERFLASYWPRFNAQYGKKLDPLLVFTQIISYIKGGCRLGRTDKHAKMDAESYIKLSHSRNSTISEQKRQMIYKIFLAYEEQKKLNGEYDISDLVLDIHHRLSIEGYGGAMMDFVYIDEVQDFTLNQLLLFKYICSNVKEGFVFSGDTAQTIAKGVDFRFEDIRSLFYTQFLAQADKPSDLFKLTQNFRTHAAVLNLAQSVLTLLYHFFPLSVDKLESETSILHGEVPIILDTCDDNVLEKMFSSNVDNNDGIITFGAQQIILVRDDSTKKQVIGQIGSNALVLTVLECKGLEFHDVLLYKFFEESALQDTWEVIYNFMLKEKLLDSSSHRYRCFDMERHSALCTELKELYVAITRTRKRLWIFERSFHPEPLFAYWNKLGVVTRGKLDRSFARKMQTFCKPEDWRIRGQKLFIEGNYESAAVCFKRAEDVNRHKWSKAAGLQTEGENKLHIEFEVASKLLSEAAVMYEEIGKIESSAICFIKARNYRAAAKIYLEKFDEPRFEAAGDCFAHAGCWHDAAESFGKGRCLSKFLSACQRGNDFKYGWDLLRKWVETVPTESKDNFLKSWISRIKRLSDIKSVLPIAREFPEDAYSYMLEKGNYVDASTVQRTKGNVLIEADLLERANEYRKSSQLLVFFIATQIFASDERSGSHRQHSNNHNQLLDKAEELAFKVSRSYHAEVCAELDFLSDRSCSLASNLSHYRRAKDFRNVTVENFSARNILEAYLKLDAHRFHHDSDAVFKRDWRFDEEDSEGCFSAQSLVNVWNMLRQRITCLFSYLQDPIHRSQRKSYKDLCQKWFGVLNLNSQDLYVAFNSQSSWLVGVDEGGLHKMENRVYMSGSVFRRLGQQFLRDEISSHCSNLLRILIQLQKSYQEKGFSFVQKAVLALQISGITQFLIEYGSNISFLPKELLNMKLSFTPLDYPESAMPSKDYKKMQDKDMAIQAVGLVLYRNLSSFNKRTIPTKIGWAILYLFFSSELIDELTWEIRYKSGSDDVWKVFFDKLLEYKATGFENASLLASTFLDGLQPMDPQRQVFLIESLLFLTSSCQIGRGWFMTTMEMLSKTLFTEDADLFHHALSVSSEQPDVSQSSKHMYDFILAIVCEILVKKRFLRARKHKNETLHFQKSLVWRLVSILALVCLNLEELFPKVRKALKNVASGVLLLLPPWFQLGLLNVKGHRGSFKIFAYLFSKALESTDNRMVLVRKDTFGESLMYLKPMLVNSSFFRQRKDIQTVLLWLVNNGLKWEVHVKCGLQKPRSRDFVRMLDSKDMEFENASSLAWTFFNTLQATNPHGQVCLIEHLLFVTSSSQIGRGWFMSTKLALSRAGFSEDRDCFQNAFSGSSGQLPSFEHIYDFMIAVVYKILSETRIIVTYKNKVKNFHQSLVMRLFTVLALVCLNSEEHFLKVQKVLRDVAGVFLVLPPTFQVELLNVMKGHVGSFRVFACLLSKALETEDNRLVLVQKDDFGEVFQYLKPLVISSSFFSQSKEVQAALMWFVFQSWKCMVRRLT